MTRTRDFVALALRAFQIEALKKIIFSRPHDSEVQRVSGRLCAHRGRRVLALEYSLPGNTVSQRNIPECDVEAELLSLIRQYKQANLITALGDAEWKTSKSGKEVLLGGDALLRKLSGETPKFESAIEALDKKKNYILAGSENFLIRLGVSDKNGRVHDKKQGKFRQINRFLEHVEDVYSHLPADGRINIFDLCCGKSYLSFAVYYYLTEIKHREVYLLGIDLKRDVILWCDALARELGYGGMKFICDDITNTPKELSPDMVISLHACDVATDVVLDTACRLGAKIILSTPCCHRYMSTKINAQELRFVTDYPHLRGKLCEALTDALRAEKLASLGYTVSVLELTDPENTPKNTLIRAIRSPQCSVQDSAKSEHYDALLRFLFGDGAEDYLKEIRK
ncbi:MAG: SAM-dependent methyltransferase [Clostridia bacterium]|nr:SAM-dependent methyltransferase [Clostridia bacterium]